MFFSGKLKKAEKYPRLFLTLGLLVSACLVYYQYVFGNSIFIFNDIGADTQQQYIMQYNAIVNHIRDGNFSAWDFTNGFGTSMLQMNLFDPSLMLLYLAGVVFGPAVMPYLLIYIHIGKIILAGLMCYQFLSCFSFSTGSRLLASYVYAFNGFLIVWGQHYQFSMIMVYLPLFLFLLEKALRRDRFSPSVPLLTTCIIIYSYYTGYMTMITGGIYLIMRLFFMENLAWKTRFKRFFINCASMLLGICMGLFSLLPAFALVNNVSSRLDSNMGIFQRILSSIAPYPLEYYVTLILRFFSSNLEGIGNTDIYMPYRGYTNYYEAPNVFFSVLFVVLAVQYIFYLFHTKESLRQKVTQWSLVFLTAAALLLMAGSLIFNGFSYPFSRHTFVLMPLFALLIAKMTDVIFTEKFFHIPGALITGVCSSILYVLCYKRVALTPSVKLNILILWGSVLLMLLLLFLVSRRKTLFGMTPSILFVLLASVTAFSVISDSHITARGRSSVSKGDADYFDYLYNSDMESLLNYVKSTDPDFYRLEKTYARASYSMESCAQDYRGIGTYNSTMNKNLIEFTEKIIPNMNLFNFSRTTYRHIAHDDVFATLFGIKYLVSEDGNYSSDAYQLVKQFGSLYLYQNQYAASVGRLYTQTVDQATYEAFAPSIDSSGLLAQTAITEAPGPLSVPTDYLSAFTKRSLPDYVSYDSPELSAFLNPDTKAISWITDVNIPLKPELSEQNAPVTMNFNIYSDLPPAITFITNNGRTDTSSFELTRLAYSEDSNYAVSLTIPADTKYLHCITRYQDVAFTLSGVSFTSQSSAGSLSKDPGIVVNNTTNDSKLTGSIAAEKDSLAFFAIPYETGWQAAVDGEPVELIRTDYGFSGFYVTAGNHTFTLTYTAPLLKEGILLSGVSFLVFLSITWISRNRNARQL